MGRPGPRKKEKILDRRVSTVMYQNMLDEIEKYCKEKDISIAEFLRRASTLLLEVK